MFGSRDNTYSVTLTLSVGRDQVSSTGGEFPSARHASGEFYGFGLLFEESISLSANSRYWLEAAISGSESWYGTQGQQTVRCASVTLTLKDSFFPSMSDGTDTRKGQFREFIFSL